MKKERKLTIKEKIIEYFISDGMTNRITRKSVIAKKIGHPISSTSKNLTQLRKDEFIIFTHGKCWKLK